MILQNQSQRSIDKSNSIDDYLDKFIKIAKIDSIESENHTNT